MKTRLILAFAALALTLGVLQTAPAAAGTSCLSFCARALCPNGCGLISGQTCGCF
jgi:hypothetical protein